MPFGVPYVTLSLAKEHELSFHEPLKAMGITYALWGIEEPPLFAFGTSLIIKVQNYTNRLSSLKYAAVQRSNFRFLCSSEIYLQNKIHPVKTERCKKVIV